MGRPTPKYTNVSDGTRRAFLFKQGRWKKDRQEEGSHERFRRRWIFVGTTGCILSLGWSSQANQRPTSETFKKGKSKASRDIDGHEEALQGWKDRWKEGRTAFHMESVHPKLVSYWDELMGPVMPGSQGQRTHPRVFVPLCGKTKDMTWMAVQGCDVFGVEIAPLAIDQFFGENGLPRTVRTVGTRGIQRTHTSGNIAILEGDLLSLYDAKEDAAAIQRGISADQLSWQLANGKGGAHTMDAVWDRGAMVAIEPKVRTIYADVIDKVLRPGGRVLLMGLQYGPEPEGEQAEQLAHKYGPPYSLSYQQTKHLFEKKGFTVSVLETIDTSNTMPPRFVEDGLKVSSVLMLLEKQKEQATSV